MPRDYRKFLRAKPTFKSVRDMNLRTKRLPDHVEIVRDHATGEYHRLVYDGEVV